MDDIDLLEYIRLCDTAEKLLKAETEDMRQRIVAEFWTEAHEAQIDEYKLGIMGSVHQLLQLLSPLLLLQPYILQYRVYDFCQLRECVKTR